MGMRLLGQLLMSLESRRVQICRNGSLLLISQCGNRVRVRCARKRCRQPQKAQLVRVQAQASVSVQSVIISLHVRSLPIVEAKADNGGAVRHCRLARRLESSVQHRSHAASPGDPAASEGTNPSNFDYALGTCSPVGKRLLLRLDEPKSKWPR